MAIGSGGREAGSVQSTLSEINVTPLVDVMLVLLTIFMVASSVETIQVAAERERLLREVEEEEENAQLLSRLESLQSERDRHEVDTERDRRVTRFMRVQEEKLKDYEEQLEDRSRNVPVDLPKVTSEAVNLAEQRKIVLSLTRELALYVGDTKIVDCADSAFKKEGVQGEEAEEAAFRACMEAVEKKLVSNEKLKEDSECYLRADRKLGYGRVLALMATVRRAGVTKFGLVSEELEAK